MIRLCWDKPSLTRETTRPSSGKHQQYRKQLVYTVSQWPSYSNDDDNHINIFGIMDGNKVDELNFNENLFLKKSAKSDNFEFHGDINFQDE